MNTTPHRDAEVELFEPVQALLRQMIEDIVRKGADVPLDGMETEIAAASRELSRRLLQARLDMLARRERSTPTPPTVLGAGAHFRNRVRSMRSSFGLVTLARPGRLHEERIDIRELK